MLPELKEIKKRRAQFGLTQSGLAQLCSVSQSLIAKTESGKIIPAYDKAKRIFDSLESMHHETSVKAKDMMSASVACAAEDEPISKVIKIMSKHGISQVPILSKEGSNIGTLSEKTILEAMRDGKNIAELKAKDIMEEAVPSIAGNSPFALVSSLLEYSPALIVEKHGKIAGIITKADLLKAALKRH